MLGRRAAWNAQRARCDVLDHKGQRRLRGIARHYRAPRELLAIGSGASAVRRAFRAESTGAQSDGGRVELFSAEGEVDVSLASGEPGPPAMRLRTIGIPEGDQLEVAAVGEGDERVMRVAAGVLATGRDGEPGALVVRRCSVEVAHGDDYMIDA